MKKAAAQLKKYREKRDFTKTQEPSGEREVVSAEHRRFVIQKHAASHLHWDLRLELNGVFKSWAVTKGPSVDPADKRLAVEVEDHPLDYGDFEGTIPKGEYGGGTVQMWDRGYWAPQGPKKPEDALAAGDFKFVLAGERLKGSFVLVKIRNNRGRDTRTNWLLIKHKDEYARPGETPGLIEEDRSVASGRTMDQIARGVGKAPKAFMLAAAEDADAVWHSNRTEKAVVGQDAKPKAAKKNAGRSKVTVKTARLASLPDFIEPQLAKIVERPPAGPGYAHEIKFDGYRVQVRVQKGKATIRTRSGLDWTDTFAAIAKVAAKLPDCIIDGEVCALDKKSMPSFAALQAALSEGRSRGLVLFAFDLLFEDQEDCRALPLSTRKDRLKALLDEADPGETIRYVEHFASTGKEVWLSACKMDLEGIVSKRLDAPYVSGRHGGWTKAKCRAGFEVVLGGWTTEAGGLRSLLAGVHRDGRLEYVGRIGTGYGEAVASKVLPVLEKHTTDTSPFSGKNAPKKEANIRWLEPVLVAEINFAGWTDTRMIRHASFKGLRLDKPASEVVDETAEQESAPETPAAEPAAARPAASPYKKSGPARAGGKVAGKIGSKSAPAARATALARPNTVMGVTISSPTKVMWPASDAGDAVTKLDLARYYEAVGEWMLPHLRGRPCSLVRAPDGIGGEQFFQRHAMAGISDLFTLVKVKDDKAPYVQIDRVEAFIAVAQIGALELHPWNCAEGDPEVAGRLVFDLDPAPDVRFAAVIEAALEIRDRLKAVGLESFCKTTGGKGLHVVTPLTGGKDAVAWPAAKNFAHIICAQMAADSPKKYLDTMAKKDRVGRIFLDYLRNDRTSTAVAVLSTRARPGATVSMPVHWKEVKATLEPAGYDIRSAPEILRKSRPWSGYEKAERSLSAAIERVLSQTRKTGRR
jgi:bifunctional non-homologous end joining protein LigD